MKACTYKPICRLLFLMLFFPRLLGGTEPYTPQLVNPLSESWRWKHFPELEGKGVRSIVEGPHGKVWMGYNEGVFEYNGYSWKVHNAENGLNAAPVEEVFAASNGYIFATAENGIFRYDGLSWSHILAPPESLPMQFISVAELSDGSLMFSSAQGVFHFREKEQPVFYTSTAKVQALQQYFDGLNWVRLPEKVVEGGDFLDISDVMQSRDGVVWFAITLPNEVGRLLKFIPSEEPSPFITDYELITSGPDFQLGEGQQLIEAMDNSIWVINSTYKTGITVFGEGRAEYIRLGDIFGGDEFMTDIVQSSDGTIWVGSLGKLHAYKNGEWEIYTSPQYAIPANRLILQKSKSNKLWVAGYKSKVFLLDFSYDRWITYAGLNYQCEEASGQQWFIDVDGKAVRRKGESWTAFTVADGLIDAPIRIMATSRGQVWTAGSHQGVAATAVLRNGKWEKHLHPKLSWGIDYRAVFEAEDGTWWFGGSVDSELQRGQLGGVLQLLNPLAESLHWVHHAYQENGLMQSNAYGIGQSADGRIWLGGGSLYYYDGGKWARPENERLRQFVNVVHSTGDWLVVGSRFYGIFIYDGKEWKNYDTSNGLPGNTIISIDAMGDNCLLVATENDICRFDGKSWVSHIFPSELNMDFEGGSIFHDEDGAIWINHSSRSWKRRAFSHSKNQGRAYRNFTTYRYLPDDNPPETEITFFEEEVSPAGNTFVEWRGRDFFAQSPSQQLAYSYRLNEGEWSPFTKDGRHTFVGLGNGEYRLEVRARDLDFNIDPTPAAITFEVLPPVWKQAWFIMLMLAFLTILAVYEYRVISKKQKLEKLNASLRLANEELKGKTRKIESQKEEILQQNERIQLQAQELEASNKSLEARNEKIRQQRDKLEEMVVQVEELSRAKLSFFTNISHELRTPLTLILGPIEQLQNQAEEFSEARRQRLYDIIQRNSARLLKLINQLLELRRIESSALELNLQPLNLPEFIRSILKLFENHAAERSISLSFSHNVPRQPVALDPDKVEKIIANLLSNSFKHTPDGGKVSLALSKVPAPEAQLPESKGEYLRISVEDTGEGIIKEDLEHIFDPYYRSGPLNRKEFSSGVGLSYIKDLVEAHGGSIKVESQKGKGTCFILFFPLLEQGQPSQSQSPLSMPSLKEARLEVQSLLAVRAGTATEPDTVSGPKAASGNGKEEKPVVLIVEDNRDMLSFIESILSANYCLRTAENGKQALAIAREEELDLILSDIMMPEMDGLEFCKLIKSNFETSHIPVILLTAKNMDGHKLAGYLTGADDYVTKPFNPELLEVRIGNLLGQRRRLRKKFTRDFMLTPNEVKLASPDEEMLQRLTCLMEEHIDDSDFNVNKMCEMVHLSHMHFIRKVKQLTGKTPSELLRSFRMKRAKDLLAQQKINISEVAYQVGYDLPNSFSRVFRQEFGMTPTEYVETL